MTPLAVSYFLLLFIIVIILVATALVIAKRIDRDIHQSARMLVIVPEGLINPLKEHRPSEISLSQELYRRLGELKIPFTLEAEVHGVGEEIHFFITVPNRFRKQTASLIETLWPSGYVQDANDYESWHSGTNESTLTVGYLEQRKPYSIPIEIAHRGHFEPFTKALHFMSQLTPLGEGAAVQWVVKAANPGVAEDIGTVLRNLDKGRYQISRHMHETFTITPENLELIKKKVSQPLFLVTARIAAASDHANKARGIMHALSAILKGRDSQRFNQLALVEKRQAEKTLTGFFEKKFEPSHAMILSAEELATLFHFPGPTTAAPKIRRR